VSVNAIPRFVALQHAKDKAAADTKQKMATYTSSTGPKAGKIEVREPPLVRDYVAPAMPVDTIKKILSTSTTFDKYTFSKKQASYSFNVNFDLMEIHWFDTKSARFVGTSTFTLRQWAPDCHLPAPSRLFVVTSSVSLYRVGR